MGIHVPFWNNSYESVDRVGPAEARSPLKTSALSKPIDKWENDWPAISAWRRLSTHLKGWADRDNLESSYAQISMISTIPIGPIHLKACSQSLKEFKAETENFKNIFILEQFLTFLGPYLFNSTSFWA